MKAPHENALILDMEGSDSVAKWGERYAKIIFLFF